MYNTTSPTHTDQYCLPAPNAPSYSDPIPKRTGAWPWFWFMMKPNKYHSQEPLVFYIMSEISYLKHKFVSAVFMAKYLPNQSLHIILNILPNIITLLISTLLYNTSNTLSSQSLLHSVTSELCWLQCKEWHSDRGGLTQWY